MEETLLGLSLGLASGLSPGPLLALVVAGTLQGGFSTGARLSMAPLVSDLPIVTLSLVALGQLPETALPLLGVVGGLVIVGFGLQTMLSGGKAELPSNQEVVIGFSIWKGAVVNFLNPNAWLFWTTVGGPLLLRSAGPRPAAAAGFLISFFALLIGSKLGIAALLAKSRTWLTERSYRLALMGCGLLLLALGASLLARSGSEWLATV